MPAAPLLSEAEIAARLSRLPGWERAGKAIRKTFKVKGGIRGAHAFVGAVLDPADEQDHHPDVEIHWNKVTLVLWTHASGGLTEKDFRLAETIEVIAAEAGAAPA